MSMLFKLISLSLTLCLSDKLTLHAHASALPPGHCPSLTVCDDPIQQRATAAPVINSWSKIPEHLQHAHLSLEGIVLLNNRSRSSYEIMENTLSTLSNWSRVGLLIRDTKTSDHVQDQRGWYVLELVADPIQTGIATSLATETYTVRLTSWQHDVHSSDDITLRHFHYDDKKGPRSHALKNVIAKYIGRQKTDDVFDANTTEGLHSMSCGELNALVLQDLGLLSKDKAASGFIPAHFSLERPKALPLIAARLGSEHEIQRAPRSIFRTVFESVTGVLRFFASKIRLI